MYCKAAYPSDLIWFRVAYSCAQPSILHQAMRSSQSPQRRQRWDEKRTVLGWPWWAHLPKMNLKDNNMMVNSHVLYH